MKLKKLNKTNTTMWVIIIGLLTLFFFPEPETNWIAYFSVFGFFISLIVYLSLKKWGK